MPALSKAQYRAMQAALHGRSTLGIPPKVGAEFVAATDEPSDLPAHAGGSEEADEAAYQHHCTERCDHHKKMARKASSPASRALHKKLQKHYEAKLRGGK